MVVLLTLLFHKTSQPACHGTSQLRISIHVLGQSFSAKLDGCVLLQFVNKHGSELSGTLLGCLRTSQMDSSRNGLWQQEDPSVYDCTQQQAFLSSTPDLGIMPKSHLIQTKLGMSISYCQRPRLVSPNRLCVYLLFNPCRFPNWLCNKE